MHIFLKPNEKCEVTYEAFAASWPNKIEQTGEYGQMMNGYPKHVVSTTPDKADWNNSSLIKGDISEEITKLKQQPGKQASLFSLTKRLPDRIPDILQIFAVENLMW